MIDIRHLSFSYGEDHVLRDISFSLQKGDHLAVLGPNGSGKSTLIRCLAGILPYQGEIRLGGIDLRRLKRQELARILAYMPQINEFLGPIEVESFVAFGRYPHRGRFESFQREDQRKVEEAMEMTGTREFAGRYLQELSGGERQKVFLAKAFAQEPAILVLDEPNTFLDLPQQLEMMRLIRRYTKERRVTLISVLHDLNLAYRSHEKALMLREGKTLMFGWGEDVFTAKNIWETFQLNVDFVEITGADRPYIYADLTF